MLPSYCRLSGHLFYALFYDTTREHRLIYMAFTMGDWVQRGLFPDCITLLDQGRIQRERERERENEEKEDRERTSADL